MRRLLVQGKFTGYRGFARTRFFGLKAERFYA